ncbi:hypothetical protein RB653_002251 [Dictyostelium firmibasis]|uniref:EGF-like domain-containing protein n=1 Tax=Dictyostelium firmibasis TaxID=79012 RepID=A0AAN7YYK9_9MYCE
MNFLNLFIFFLFFGSFSKLTDALSIDRFEQINSTVNIYGSGFGNDPNVIYFYIGTQYYTSNKIKIDVIDSQVSFQIFTVGVYNGMLKVVLNSDTFEYGNIQLTPTILTVTPPNGGIPTGYTSNVIIYGAQFDATQSKGEIYMNDNNITSNCNVSSTFVNYPISYQCEIPPGFGIIVIRVKVGDMFSNNITLWYRKPSIEVVGQALYLSNELVEISGNEFQNGTFDKTIVTFDGVQVEISSSTARSIFIKHNNTIIPKDRTKGFKVVVTVAGIIASVPNLDYDYFNYFTYNYVINKSVNGTYILDLAHPNWNYTDFILNNITVKSYCQVTRYPLLNIDINTIARLICDFPPSIKSGSAYFTDGYSTLNIDVFLTPYVSIPSTQQINDWPLNGGEISFYGKHFDKTMFNGSSNNLVINYNGNTFTNYNLINNTFMTFNIPPGNGTNNLLYISSVVNSSQPPFNITFVVPEIIIDSIVQINQSLLIKGSNLIITSSMIITLSGIDITSYCNNNVSDIICGPTLPIGVKSGQLLIESNGYKSATYILYLTPVITSIYPNLFDTTSNETLTINGVYFESIDPISQNSNNLQILIDDTVVTSVFINSTSITTTILPGVGSNHQIKVSINQTRFSNNDTFSYYQPIILDFKQTNNQFEIKGNYLGINSEDNKVYYNNIQIESKVSSLNNLEFTLLDSFSNGEVYVQVGNQKSNIYSTFLTPIINSISKKPYVDGSSVITVYGNYFSNLNYQTKQSTPTTFEFILDNNPSNSILLPCNYIDTISYSCEFTTKGYGNAILSATKTDSSNTYISNSFNLSYQEPKVIQSTSLFYKVAGLINITVESYSADSLQVFVSNSECTNAIALINKQIQCNYQADIPPNSDGKSLNITVISNSMVGINEVFYYNTRHECPNNCSNHGICNLVNGQCKCSNEWQSNDCSQEKQPPLPEPSVDNNGETTLDGGNNINFTVSITYLRETDLNGKTVKVLSLKDIKWNNQSQISKTQSYFNGTFDNESVQVELDVTFFKDEENFDFAGDTILIPSNSMKYIILISNWNFTSPLNNLQVIYNSQTTAFYDNGCEIIQANSSSNLDEESKVTESVTWFQLVSGNSAMDAKFSRRMFVDDRVRMASVSILDSNDSLYNLTNQSNSNESYKKLIAITTPYFRSNVKLDPSFSSLLQPSSTSECENKNKWKIPVIAVLCSVGGTTIAAITATMLYKSYKNKKINSDFASKLKNANKK